MVNYPINMNTITIDFEIGIRNSLIKNFPAARLIGCLFHYKNSLYRNLVKLGLYRSETRETSDEVLSICGLFPFILPINEKIIYEKLNIIINNKSYKYFLNYFINTWFTFLQSNNLLDYTNISKSFRSNCFIENYNGRIKRILGNKRLIQWPNLLSFLNKEEEYYREILILKDSEPRFNILKNKLEEYSQNFDNNVIIKKSQNKESHQKLENG